jgi:predicted ATPase/signal transduction histidine kinase/CheY-like chemotaxis protein
MNLSDYAFETLRRDGEFAVYRGRPRRHADASPSILATTPVLERPASASLRRMEHEYSFKAELDPGWAARPLAHASHEGRTMLVLSDPGGEPLDRLLEKPMELTEFLRMAVGLSAALGQMHGRGLVHKDLKPANILVDRASGIAWLTGFGIASRLPRERRAPAPPESIAGTLAYMAPEGTGRMNRSIDSRSDLYSLGVTFYQMLTGSLPFTASDPMEWVHCHIARKPVPPSERLEGIPAPVSQIIMKLLAKTAEGRYQTAAGVESDLRRCLAEWEQRGRIGAFALGEHDTPDRLLIPEKLYGRTGEVDTLSASFDRVLKSGTPELVLVSGYSGVGKSSVVHELHKMLVPPSGLFASGKFDQYRRDIPYATLAQALQSLVQPLLGKSDAELASWRDALREALGANGPLLCDLVPELKLIIGEQPPVPDLPSADAQRRFHLVFRRFINVFARPEHPLVLFLDDLQWLDAATLDLLEDLFMRRNVQHLLLIGAYRDNEVNSSHPLKRKLDAIRAAGATVQEITVAPLASKDVRQLIADALHCEAQDAAPLAQLVHKKTAGNPFFAIQFLNALADERLLTFAHGQARWRWDLNRIHAKGYTDNVVDLIVGKLNRLPVKTQKALQEFACLGNSAEVSTLSIVRGASEDEVHADLWEAVRQDLVVRSERSYKFVHDRVQEAAYSLVPESSRAQAHLRIGTRLRTHTPPEKREEALFDIVNQLNRGAVLIGLPEERERLAELNLMAGKRAKACTAYEAALAYLSSGCGLLDATRWKRRYRLAFELELLRAECEILTGALTLAENRLLALAEHATNQIDRAAATRACLSLYITLDRLDRAIEVGLEYLRHVGIEWSPRPGSADVDRELERMWQLLGGRTTEQLLELPLMRDPDCRATMDVLCEMLPPAGFFAPNLLELALLRMVNLSLEHGHCDASCFAYCSMNAVLGFHLNDYQMGLRFGQLSHELVEKHGLDGFKARTLMHFGAMAMPWVNPLSTGRPLLRRALDTALETGDLHVAICCGSHLTTNLLDSGESLANVEREIEAQVDFLRRSKSGIDTIMGQRALVRMLRGLTPEFGSFDDETFDERRFEQRLEQIAWGGTAVCRYWIRKLQARFMSGDYVAAAQAGSKAGKLIWSWPSFFEEVDYHFFDALVLARLCDTASAGERDGHLKLIVAHHDKLARWAKKCPENFGSCSALVGAEIARIEGRALEAESLYEQAIRSAHSHGFVNNEAIAYELAARFYAARGFQKFADAYLLEARYRYQRWEADGKVAQLDRLHPHLGKESSISAQTSTILAPAEQLDLATVIKVSQAVSGEIVLEKMLDTLMLTAIEHAGAERGLLILARAGEQRVAAEVTTAGDRVVVQLRDQAVAAAMLPQSVFQFVLRTQQSVILDDAAAQSPFSSDPYIREHRARSVLCLPLLKQAKLIGVLYLENRLAARVFTPAQIAVLNLLASQAAMSLENAQLYADQRRSEERYALAVQAAGDGHTDWIVATDELYASPRLVEMLGLPADTRFAGRADYLARVNFHPEDRERALRTVEEFYAGDSARVEFDFRILRGGETRWLHVTALCSRDAMGAVQRSNSAVTDITGRKLAEEELETMERKLRQAQRLESMGTFAGGIAHDFNNILGAILGYGEIARRAAPKGSQLAGDLASIMTAGERGRALVGRLLTFSRSVVGERVPVHVERVVREALDVVSAKLPPGVTVQAQLHAGRATILGDATQVHQVATNLATNAIHAMSAGGTLRVEVANARVEAPRAATIGGLAVGEYVVLTVADTGAGIAPEILERIFDPFFTTKEVGTGTGLGLSLVHGIVTQIGGAIDVASTVGSGSTFTVYLPHSGDAADSEESAELALPRGDGQRVLVVDDEELLLKLAMRTLEELGYVPVGFTSGGAALAAFRAEPRRFGAVITDERMAGISGSALIREVRGIRSSIPVVLMSGYVDGGVASRARDAGADEVLKKPLLARDLAASLARVLRL